MLINKISKKRKKSPNAYSFPKGDKNPAKRLEVRKKMSESKKGEKNPAKRPEVRKKISEAHKGKKLPPFTEEHKRRMSLGIKGKKKQMKYKHYPKKSKALMGSKHWNWKGGITPLVLQIRHCFKYRQWRSDIFTRDNFTCVWCGKRGSWIEADHYPKKFSDIFHENHIKTLEQALECEEFWNVNNGRTLCQKCHDKTKRKVFLKKAEQ